MNRHDFLVLRFCVANLSKRIFTLEQIFVGKIFPVSFICENLFLRIAGKIAKIRTSKHFVLHGKSCHACHTRFEVFNSSAGPIAHVRYMTSKLSGNLSGGLLPRILGGDVPPGSLDCDCISDQKKSFSRLVFRPVL